MSLDDVVTRLREGAAAVPPARVDSSAVLARAKRALRRRRRRQALARGVVVGAVALTVASPVHVPGVGTLTVPGGYELRQAAGLGVPEGPAPEPGVDVSELLARFGWAPPSAEVRAREVAALDLHVLPVLEELRPTWFELDACQVITYPRGTFSDDGECGGRPGELPFDDVARAGFDRLVDAIDRSGVPARELIDAAYGLDGTVETVGFFRSGGGIEWNYAYRYSPDVPLRDARNALGPITRTPIGDTGWWFEQSPND